jgi:hypothetical protein
MLTVTHLYSIQGNIVIFFLKNPVAKLAIATGDALQIFNVCIIQTFRNVLSLLA